MSAFTNSSLKVVTVGLVGPRGPAGTGGGEAQGYLFEQAIVSDVWEIEHNLGFRPNVTVFDSAHSQVEGEVFHQDSNSLTVTFSAAFSGYAVLS